LARSMQDLAQQHQQNTPKCRLESITIDTSVHRGSLHHLVRLHDLVGLGLLIIFFSLKGFCYEKICFLKVYKDKEVLSVHALIVFTTFCCLVDEKI
jgi:hypothetical protein